MRVIGGRRESDGGTYWCVARNTFGVVRSKNATLTVACKYNFVFNLLQSDLTEDNAHIIDLLLHFFLENYTSCLIL